jgi:hypothetical protein
VKLDTVVLTHDIDKYGLKQGDIGAVVHCYRDGMAFEVEFVTAEGRTIALLTLSPADIRPFWRQRSPARSGVGASGSIVSE